MLKSEYNRSSYAIMIGMLLYSLSSCILSSFGLEVYYEYLMSFAILIIVFSYIFYRPKVHFLYHQSYLNFLLFVYISLYILAIFRGFDLRQRSSDISMRRWLIQIFTDKYYILWGLLPLMAMTISKTFNFSRLIHVSEFLCLFSIFSISLNLNKIISLTYSLYFQSEGTLYSVAFAFIFDIFAFFLVGLSYIKDKKFHFIIIITFLVTLIFRILMARRGDVAMFALLAIFTILSYRYRQSKVGKIYSIALIFIILAFFSAIIMQTDVFSMMKYRWTEDTRSGVNNAVLSSMSTPELIFGKGINGSYYLSHDENMDYFYNGKRYIAETGFLTLMLKGGLLMAVVYILLWLIPALMGIFKSKNTFCKFTGLYLFWNVLYLYPFGNPEFSFNQLLVWTLAGIVSSPAIRRLSDEKIKALYF